MSNVMSWIFSVGWVLRSQQANSVITISRRTEQGTASRHASFLIGRQREKYSSTGQPFVLFTEVFLDIYLRASFGGCYIIVLGAYSTIVSMQGQPLHNNFVGFSLPIAWDIWEHSREPNMLILQEYLCLARNSGLTWAQRAVPHAHGPMKSQYYNL